MTLLQSFTDTSMGENLSVHPIAGQSFILTQRATISSVKFLVSKTDISPTGNVSAEIYEHTGTFGVNGLPTGAALATSDLLDLTTFPVVPANAYFEFVFSTPYGVNNNRPYCIVLNQAADNGVRVLMWGDGTSPTHPGNAFFQASNLSWIAYSGKDMDFYLYGNWIAPSITGIQSIQGVQSITF